MKLKPNLVITTNWALLKLIYRAKRQGFPEVIFGQGKTKEQIDTIITSLSRHHHVILVTRINEEKANYVLENIRI